MASKDKNRIDFLLDFKKGDVTAFESLKRDIAEIQRMANDIDFVSGFDQKEIQDMVNAARILDKALDQAFDVNLNTINIQKFNNILKQGGYNAEKLQMDLATAGTTGQQAFLKATGQLMQFNTAIKQTNKFLDGLAISFFNTVKWGIMSSIMNNISGTIQKSYYYVKDLDSALNDIRIVTGKSADEMAHFAEQANNAAKSLAVTTEDYTQGSLIYYQQGLDDETVKTLTDITAKTSNVTGQTMGVVSEQLTAVWNGYKVANEAAEEGMQVYEEYVDKMAAVGATTASDLQELSTAMSKVASAASSMGVTFDDLNAQIATIVSVTRQAPESVGTALKTIYARLGDLKVDGVDEFGVKLGEVTTQLQTMGINILDQNGNMREMSGVMAEVAEKWDTWTSAQRQAAAVAMAGKRQYNNLVALFDNWDMYGEALETSLNAAGTLEKQQETAMESLANKMDVLKATAEDLYDSLFDTNTINNFIESGTKVLQLFTDFTDSVGGLNNILPMLGSLGLQVFSEQIGRGLSTIIINAQNAKNEVQIMKDNFEQIKLMFSDAKIFNVGEVTGEATAQQLKEIEGYYEKMYQYQSIMNQEQKQQYNNILNNKIEIGNNTVSLEQQLEEWKQINERVQLLGTELIIDASKSNELNKEVQNLKQAAEQLEVHFNSTFDWKKYQNAPNLLGHLKHDIKEFLGDINLSEKQVNLLYQRINKLSSADKLRTELHNIINDMRALGTSSEEIDKVRAKIDQLTGSTEVLDNALTNALSTQQLWTNIARTVGAIGQLATSLNTLSNIGDIIKNDDLNAWEKFIQITMNLSFVVSGLSMAFKSLSEITAVKKSIEALSLGFDILSTKMAINTAKQAYAATVTKVFTKAEKDQYKAILAKITAEDLEEISIGKKTAKEVLANKVAGTKVRLYDDVITKASTKITLDALEMKSIQQKTAANNAFNASLLANPITWVVAGVVAAIGVISLISQKIQKERDAITELNKELRENNKEIQNEINAHKNLISSYNQLYNEYLNTSEATQELHDKTLELINIYDIQNGKILLQAQNYSLLAEKIREARKEELQTNISLASENASTTGYDISNKLAEGLLNEGSVVNGIYTYSYGNSETDYVDPKLKEISETFGDFNISSRGEVDYNFDIYNPEEVYKYTQIVSKNIDYLKTKYGEAEIASNGFYKSQLEQYKRLSEYMPELEEYMNTIYSSKTEYAILDKLDINKIAETTGGENTSEYFISVYNTIKDIKEELSEDIPENKLDKYINESLENLDELPKEVINKIQIVNSYLKKYPLDANLELKTDDILKTIGDLNEKQLAYLALHLNTIPLDQELSDWIEDHKPIFDYYKNAEISANFREFIGSYDEKKGFEEGSVSGLFSSEEVRNNFGITEEHFTGLDVAQQLQVATTAWVNYTKATETARKDITGILQQEVNDAKAAMDDWSEHDMTKNFEQQAKGIDGLKNNIGELKAAFIKLGNEGYENLEPHEQALIDKYTESTGIIDAQRDALGKNLAYSKQVIDTYNDLNYELQDLIEQEYSFEEVIEAVNQSISVNNKLIDDLQKTYKALAQIVDDYNETGHWTVDNVQSLMEMSDKYVAQLDIEGNTLSLNTESYKEATIAKLDDLIANEELAYQLKMTELATIATKYANDAAAQADALRAKQLAALGLIAEDTADKMWDLSNAIYNINTWGSDDLKAASQEATQAHRNRLQALENLKEEIQAASADEFRTLMNADSKSKSSSKDKKDKEKKELEDEFNKYFDIEKAIEAVDRQVSLLEEHQKNLHGKELIDSLKQENELIEKQTENYKKLYEAQQEEAKELGAILKGKGLEFTDDGAISNYAEATTAALAKYNAAVDAYNAGTMDDAAFEIQEKAYERFKKQLERYEELYYKEMTDTFDKIDENNRKVLDNNLKAWETEIQIQLDLNEAEREWNKFFKEIGTDFKKVFKDLQVEIKAIAAEAKTYQSDIAVDIKAINDTMAEIDKLNADQATDHTQAISQAQEKLKDLNDQLMDHASSLHQAVENAWDAYLEGIDQAAEKFDKLNDQFDRINNQLEFQGELIELMYGEKAYDLMDKLYEGQEHASRNQIQSVQQQLDFWKKLYNETSEGDKDHEKALEKMNELQDELNDLTLDYIKLLKNEYSNTIKKALNELEKQLTGGTTVERLKDQWEQTKKFTDAYLNDVEKAAKIQALSNKIQKEINKTDNTQSQQKLNKFRDQELKKLKEKEYLSEADLERSEKALAILQAEIALEEAQNNKNTMKLVRNEQGNWSYQYVADEEDITDKIQTLSDAKYELMEFDEEQVKKNTDAYLSLLEDFLNKVSELYQKFQNHELTEDELNEDLNRTQEMFLTERSALVADHEQNSQNLMESTAVVAADTYSQEEEAFSFLIDSKKVKLDEFKQYSDLDYLQMTEAIKQNFNGIGQSSNDLMNAMQTRWDLATTSMELMWNGDDESVRVAVENAYSAMQVATQEYEDKITELEELVRMKFYGKEGEENIVNSIKTAEDETDVLKEKTKTLVIESGKMLEDLRTDLNNTTQEWINMRKSIEDAMTALAKYLTMQGKAVKLDAPSVSIDATAEDKQGVASSASEGKDYTGTSGDSDGDNDKEETSSKFTYKYFVTEEDGTDTITGMTADLQTAKNIIDTYRQQYNGDGYIRVYKDEKETQLRIPEYRTGGYTGEWNGDNGKLAVLHKKEMVLNADDTANLLNTVSIMRNLQNKALDTAYQMAAIRTQMSASSYSGGTSPVQTDTGSTFYIDRLEFPNANSVDEIRMAIMSLPNVASQYVNRNVK